MNEYTPNPYQQSPAPAPNTTPVLVFGILAICFACTFYLSFLGIIFGAIARSKAKAITASGYALGGKAKTGSILGLLGLIFGIILTVVLVIVIIAGAAAASYYW